MSSRKPLTDPEMVRFLRGGDTNTPSNTLVSTPQQGQTLLERLQSPAGEGTKRFCVDLPVSMHTRLTELASRVGRPKTEVIRLLLEQALTQIPAQED